MNQVEYWYEAFKKELGVEKPNVVFKRYQSSRIFMKLFPTAQVAFDRAMEKCGEDACVPGMPYGGSTLPVVV